MALLVLLEHQNVVLVLLETMALLVAHVIRTIQVRVRDGVVLGLGLG